MTTTAIPVWGGRNLSSCVTAARPPAEAPIPTTGNEANGSFGWVLVREGSDVFPLAGLAFFLSSDFRDLVIPPAPNQQDIKARLRAIMVKSSRIVPTFLFAGNSVNLPRVRLKDSVCAWND